MSSQTFFPSSPGPSSSGRLRPRRSREQSSSQVDLGFGLGSSQTLGPHGGTQGYEHDGQEDIFKDLVLPPLDDPDDLSYEESDGGGRASKRRKANASVNGNDGNALLFDQKPAISKGKGKGKARQRSTEPRTPKRSASATPAMKDEPRSDYDFGTSYDEGYEEGDFDDDLPFWEEEERSNKFQGASKTWRTWTKKERVEFDAMEKIRARDLSAHLFNAFALRKRARELDSNGTSRTITPATGTASVDENLSAYPGGEGTNFLFTPPKGWTAWPMPANIVPRADENRFRDPDDFWTIRIEPDSRGSGELEECVMAEMLRAAKDRFNARPWKEGGGGMESGRTSRHGSRAPTVVSGMDDEISGKEYSEVESEVVDVEEYMQMPVLKPVVTADDEKSKIVLRPAARHILTRLDDLLLGLHRARQSYVTTGGMPKVDPDVEAGYSQDDSTRTKKRGKMPTNDTDRDIDKQEPVQEIAQDTAPNPASPPPPSRKKRKRTRSKSKSRQFSQEQTVSQLSRQQLLGRRDWSDVLGVASMTGWPAAAVMRASRRCAELFGEDMFFRTMDEGKLQFTQDEDDKPSWKYVEEGPEEVSPVNAERSRPTVPQFIGKLKEYAIYCPVKECSRHTKGFSRTWNLNQHMKNKHPDEVRLGVKSDTKDEDP